MKKFIIAGVMLINILVLQNIGPIQKAYAQEVGLGDVVFQDRTPTPIIGSGFLINELSYNIIKLHLIIAGKSIQANGYEEKTLSTIKKLEELTKTDIIETLSVSTNKAEALNKYLNDCYQNLQVGDTISSYMKQEMVVLKGDMDACIAEKSMSDKAYFDAVDSYDQNMMESSLKDSISYETCATQNRIQYNAKTEIAQKLVFYLGMLQQKYDILSAKQDILAKNFEIFRDNTLPDLNQIDQLLQQFKL